MATALQVQTVRLYLNDDDSSNYDFTDVQITAFIDADSVNYAILELAKILRVRLRKELLEKSDTGIESESLAPLRDRLALMESLIEEFQKKLDIENDNTTGVYISTIKPTIGGGDV